MLSMLPLKLLEVLAVKKSSLLMPSLVNSDANIVSAVKVALGTADQDEIARQVRIYLRSRKVDDLQSCYKFFRKSIQRKFPKV